MSDKKKKKKLDFRISRVRFVEGRPKSLTDARHALYMKSFRKKDPLLAAIYWASFGGYMVHRLGMGYVEYLESIQRSRDHFADSVRRRGVITLEQMKRIQLCPIPFSVPGRRKATYPCEIFPLCPFCHVRRFGFPSKRAVAQAYESTGGFAEQSLLLLSVETRLIRRNCEVGISVDDWVLHSRLLRDDLVRVARYLSKSRDAVFGTISHVSYYPNDKGLRKGRLRMLFATSKKNERVFATRLKKAVDRYVADKNFELPMDLTVVSAKDKRKLNKFAVGEVLGQLIERPPTLTNARLFRKGVTKDDFCVPGKSISYTGVFKVGKDD